MSEVILRPTLEINPDEVSTCFTTGITFEEINFLKRELVKCQNSLNEFVSLAEGEISQRNTEIENLENSIACLKNDIMKLNREMDFLVS